MINFVIWLVVGGLIGWAAGVVMQTDREQGLVLHIVVGNAGAALGCWLVSPLIGIAPISQGDLSVGALFVSLLSAIILLAVVILVRRGATR